MYVTNFDKHSTRANSKVSDQSKTEFIYTSCRSESSFPGLTGTYSKYTIPGR